MPYVLVEMLEGRTVEQKRELVKRITEAVVDVVKVEPKEVEIRILNVKREDWAKGGQLFIDRK
jgi:4-oxalocrotonate tautomerase